VTEGAYEGWRFACPACGTTIANGLPATAPSAGAETDEVALSCSRCLRRFARLGPIWDFLLPDDAAATALFVREYTLIRRAESRTLTAESLRALPDTERSDPRRLEWRVRKASWEAVARDLLPRLARERARRPLKIVDAGAGNGWLSNRLAVAGHRPLALDLRVDGDDGLGAAAAFDGPHGPATFERARATFQRLPIPTGEADAVIFNAALHYSPSPETALREAVRVVGPRGCVAILDSPFYARSADGERMLVERRASFRARYGTASTAHGGPEYFTWHALRDLTTDVLGLLWEEQRPWRGMRFAARPLLARLGRRRPPATFPVVVLWQGSAAASS
jgi:SAM-dependent methyltransferase